MNENNKTALKSAGIKILRFLKICLIAALIGAVGGVIGSIFHLTVDYATELRLAQPWILYLLPILGLVIVFLYKICKTEGKGTDDILRAVRTGEKISPLLIPAIFIATALTHLGGGSAGREGAALQIGGGIGGNIGRLFRLNEKEKPLAITCGMSAVFSALFGTPIGATIFALEVVSVGKPLYAGFVPGVISSLVAVGAARLFRVPATRFTIPSFAMSFKGLLSVAVLALLCALLSVLFCFLLRKSEGLTEKYLKNPYIRVIIGGVIVIVLTLLIGNNDYNGAGMNIIARAVEEGKTAPLAFILKIILTVATLSCGFKGGEVVPSFFIGATFGCLVGPLLGIPAGFSAALALIGVFCGAVNCPLTSLLLAIEMFNGEGVVYFAVVCFIAYATSGRLSLYREQISRRSKLDAEIINKRSDE